MALWPYIPKIQNQIENKSRKDLGPMQKHSSNENKCKHSSHEYILSHKIHLLNFMPTHMT